MMMATSNIKMQPARLAMCIAFALANAVPVVNARDSFNAELVELDNPGMAKADLSAFESGSQAPGKYHVDIILDDQLIETSDIDFVARKDGQENDSLQPCLSMDQLKNGALKRRCSPTAVESTSCVNLRAIPHATTDFQFGAQRLVISIPGPRSTCLREGMSRQNSGTRGSPLRCSTTA